MSKKANSGARKAKEKSYRRWGIPLAIAAFLLIMVLTYFAVQSIRAPPGPSWHLDNGNLLVFDNQEPVSATLQPIEATSNYTLEKVTYQSFGDNIYGLLRIPNSSGTKPPVVIVLPGATVNKEADSGMANALSSWGYASLTLDERGNNGETPGPSAMDVNGGYQSYTQGDTPVQYKQIYDILLAYDYIKSRQDLNGNDVAILGESMGGRFAIIAAAMEPEVKGVFTVSAGPYGLQSQDDPTADKFITSIEPASYLSKLPPRKLSMFHFTNDSTIPINMGKSLYDAAGEPKAWHEYEGNTHGVYSETYAGDLHDELRSVLS
ncbi:MAG TPA: alpha/beta fold hydrolase [Methanocella sp.]|nr:alpha/beta fold hydrolase [Methanocella sp.]